MPTALLQRLDALTLQIMNSVVPFPKRGKEVKSGENFFAK
jgi:hypothetical protein